MSRPPLIVPLGACLLHQPLVAVGRHRGRELRFAPGGGHHIPHIHTFGEMLQLLRALRGEIEVPEEIAAMTGLAAGRSRAATDPSEADVVIVEPNTPVEIVLGRWRLQRNAIMHHIVRPIREAHPGSDVLRLTGQWVSLALSRGAPDAAELGKKLAPLMPESELAPIAREVLRRARGVRREIAPAMARLRKAVGLPMAGVTYTFRYMPDGRPADWHPGFRREFVAACRALGVPYCEPWRLVSRQGVAKALKDFGHYTDEFDLIVGDRLIKLAGRATHPRGASSAPASAGRAARAVRATLPRTPMPLRPGSGGA